MTSDEILEAVIDFIGAHGYPGQSPYRERLVDLCLEAFEQGGPTAEVIGDTYAARHDDNPAKLAHTTERWAHWWELLRSGRDFGTCEVRWRPPKERVPPHLRGRPEN